MSQKHLQKNVVSVDTDTYSRLFTDAYGPGVVPTCRGQDVVAIAHHHGLVVPEGAEIRSYLRPDENRVEINIYNSSPSTETYVRFVRELGLIFHPGK